jgi:hypothetical protein
MHFSFFAITYKHINPEILRHGHYGQVKYQKLPQRKQTSIHNHKLTLSTKHARREYDAAGCSPSTLPSLNANLTLSASCK